MSKNSCKSNTEKICLEFLFKTIQGPFRLLSWLIISKQSKKTAKEE
uniref:Uncharacterized protein n=1 Tax=Anguilla anguilla TaxID=7936 RepID=A0A0E9SIG6_ANGAN